MKTNLLICLLLFSHKRRRKYLLLISFSSEICFLPHSHPHRSRCSPIHFLTLRAFPSSQTTQTRCWGRLGIFLSFLCPFLLHCCFHLIFPSYFFLPSQSPVSSLPCSSFLSICWSLEGAQNKLGTAYLVIENSPYASFRPLCCCEGCECAVGGGAPTLNWKIYDTTKAAQEKGSKREKSLNGTRENIENPCSGRREIESQEKQRQHWENISVSLNGVIFQHWWKC